MNNDLSHHVAKASGCYSGSALQSQSGPKHQVVNAKRLLLIDDDSEFNHALSDYLAREGYQVTHCNTGEQGLRLATSQVSFDLVLLGAVLPLLSGFDVLRKLRQSHLTPVVLLTSANTPFDNINGLEMGADDVVSKPMNMRELVARIRAVLRRVEYVSKSHIHAEMRVGPLSLNSLSQQVKIDSNQINLTDTEFSILRCLIVNRGQVTNKEAISQAVFRRHLAPFDRSIDVHISNIRKKLSHCGEREFIRTIRGGGYMFVEFWG